MFHGTNDGWRLSIDRVLICEPLARRSKDGGQFAAVHAVLMEFGFP